MTDRIDYQDAVSIGNHHWCNVPASIGSRKGVMRLLEPRGTDIPQLLLRLRAGEYASPFVFDDGTIRRLHFDMRYVQSEMSLARPDTLNLAYTRKMMTFMPFMPSPAHVVIVGLGGGSLTKFCYRQLPNTRVTTVEIDQRVISFGELFQLPGEDERMRIVHADAADYFAGNAEFCDVVLLDGCDKDGVAPALCDPGFHRSLHARLRPQGMLVMNLIGQTRAAEAVRRLIATIYAGPAMVMEVRNGGNHLLFAFKNRHFVPDWALLRLQAKQLLQRHGLDFPRYLNLLRPSSASALAPPYERRSRQR